MKFENIGDLRVLVETARGGSLTAAARTLEVTPAAASAMLKRLEQQLGLRLFERSTRAMRLTAQGQTLLDYAERALELLEEGAAQALSASGALRGTVRLAVPSDLGRSLLPPWLDDFMALHPGVHVALSVGDQVQDVRRDAVDLALRYGAAQPDSQLVMRTLYSAERVACAAPAYLQRCGTPQHPEELARHNCLTLHISGRRELRWRFDSRPVPGRTHQSLDVSVAGDRSADDGAIVRDWALAGVGIVYKSALDIREPLRDGRLVALLPQWRGQSYALSAVLPSNRFIPARVRALVDYLGARFAALAAAPAPG